MYVLGNLTRYITVTMADPAVMRLKQMGPTYQCDACSYKGTKTQVGHHAVMKHLKLQDVPFLRVLSDERIETIIDKETLC